MLIDERIVGNNIFNFATNDLSQYTIHTAYLKTDWFNDNDWTTVQPFETDPRVDGKINYAPLPPCTLLIHR